MSEKEMTLVFYNPAEVLLMKAALVNYKKAPFVSKQEMIILEELLDRVNELQYHILLCVKMGTILTHLSSPSHIFPLFIIRLKRSRAGIQSCITLISKYKLVGKLIIIKKKGGKNISHR